MSLESRAQVKEISAVERELSIVVPGDAVAKELDKAYRKLSSKVRLKGFRQGKVPRYVLEQYYKEQTEADVLERIVGESYREAIESHKLVPVSPPNIKAQPELIPGMDFSYSARVEVKPEIELKQYEGLTIKRKKYHVADESLQRELEALRERYVKVVPVEDRKVIQQGDLVQVNYSGTVDGEHVRGLGGVSYVVEVGAGRFYPEAEQALVGKELEAKIEVEVKVPDDFRVEAVRGKQAVLSIIPNQIKKKDMPALDDEFAKDVSDDYESLADLKQALKTNLERQVEVRTRNETREAAIDALIEANPFEVPSSLVERHAEQLAAEPLSRLPEEQAQRFWASQRQRLMEDARPRALRRVRGGLLLEAIVAKEKLTASEEDVDNHLKRISEEAGQPYKTLKNLYKSGRRRDELKDQLATEKALDLIIEKASLEEESASL